MLDLNIEDLECIEEIFVEENIQLLIRLEDEGLSFMAVYENGEVLREWISDDEVLDCYEDWLDDNERLEDIEPSLGGTLLSCIGWRLEEFQKDNYVAQWLN